MSISSNEKKSPFGRFAIKRNTEKGTEKKKRDKEEKEHGRKLASPAVSISSQPW
jgi:hypothetical protein